MLQKEAKGGGKAKNLASAGTQTLDLPDRKASALTTTPRRQLDYDFQIFFIAFFDHLILIGTKYSYIWSEITSELLTCICVAEFITGDVNGCVGLADLAHSKTNVRSFSWTGLP